MAIRNCPECGHELADRGRYCPFCGCDVRKAPRTAAPQAARQAASGTEPAYTERKSPWTGILVLAAALCVIAAVLGFLYTSEKGGDPGLLRRSRRPFSRLRPNLYGQGL